MKRATIPIRQVRDWSWYEALGEMIVAMRTELKMDHAQMAKALGLREEQLKRLERGDLRLTDAGADRLGKQLYALAPDGTT